MVSSLHSLGLHGINVFMIKVEADLSNGLPSFEVTGLPDAAMKKSHDRVRTTLKSCGFAYPVSKTTVNLTPADKRKGGPIHDLPVLAVLLYALGQLERDTEHCAMVGELPLSGKVRSVEGILSMALTAKQAGITDLFVPAENAPESAVVEGLRAYPVTDIRLLVVCLIGQHLVLLCVSDPFSDRNTAFPLSDFSEVRGQEAAKHALGIAASGSHNVLLIGPSGSGRSMLVKRVPPILSDMTLEETTTTTQIHLVVGMLPGGSTLMWEWPSRTSHHTISPAGPPGGGTVVRPEEILLAHNSVPLSDELPELHRDTMEVLYQPLEDGTVTISRAGGNVTHPSPTMLVAAMSPCPCGYPGHPTKTCVCSSSAVGRYLSKVSGPLLGHLGLHVEVPLVEFDVLPSSGKTESSARIRKRVNAVRGRQNQRFHGAGIICNARITSNLLHKVRHLGPGAQTLLKTALERMGLSVKAFDQVLKIFRIITDLDSCDTTEPRHAAEVVRCYALDQKYWSVP